ncbi:actin-related protein 2/3 complex subunit 1A-like isoform X2 [Homarus americanus]|uniref:actin-related protein 2/3 complex subunit 1A-like isoform X2 n=1 Tax=Homarus americanus TaxID=6706 RepID=UPI001C45A32C|nr:actin-related protein 2/3 complex subunit 1A-like isoform X2 [Homarus americanus]XP_042237598.1 actin-related protein 2/3 complex subunit 1A-like isoform X2 [Homarus americanus]
MTEVFRFGLVPIACRARNEDRSQVALSLNNNEVNIYGRAASEWKLQETLQGHDLRVTGIDWAPSTNRIVTCGATLSGQFTSSMLKM